MTTPYSDRVRAEQVRQRARVGLIGLASAILATVNREQPVSAAGAARPDVVANMADTPALSPAGSEPLVEMGVAPSTGNATGPAPTATHAR